MSISLYLLARFGAILTLPSVVLIATGCDPRLVIGTFACTQTSTADQQTDEAISAKPLVIPWSTSFEDGFCDYSESGDYCYSEGTATYKLVDKPVHTGKHAAAFTVFGDATMLNTQARCVRQGTLPKQAYYNAWYYIPTVSKNTSIWNLIHFHGGDSPSDTLHGIWDISLINDGSGGLRLDVYDFIRKTPATLIATPQVPIGSWFHIQVFLKRASDSTGAITILQDGTPVLQMSGVATDDTRWGQWYVGSLAIDLEPDEATLFVDDVSIRESP